MARFEPFHCTIDDVTKPVPLMLSVTAEEPALMEDGTIAVTDGTGLFTVKVVEALPPPGVGFTTLRVKAPAVATSLAETAAVS